MIVIGVFYNLPIEKTREIESQIKRERERFGPAGRGTGS